MSNSGSRHRFATLGAAIIVATAAVAVGVVVVVHQDAAPVGVARSWAWPAPDRDGVIRYADLSTKPTPPGQAQPSVSDTDAVRVVETLHLDGSASGAPRITLRSASSPHDGDRGEGFTDRLAWILVYPRSPLVLSGPLNLDAADRWALHTMGGCVFVIALDADTGAVLTSLHVCRPAATEGQSFGGRPLHAGRRIDVRPGVDPEPVRARTAPPTRTTI